MPIIVAFIAVWGLGVFLTYLKGMKKFSISGDPVPQGMYYQQEQRRIADETKRQQQQLMSDYKYQLQKAKDSKP